MSTQIKKHTRARRGTRRSHHFLKPKTLSACLNCGSAKKSHHQCPRCKKY
ncbi:MAG: 50S ribosomal protein L32 [Candidatus Jacksonbacteria bacterium RIFCSPHIGHO2_02_FULL_44_25]|nr:MAG: 50S ribosomal protein L32 [Candidatus Jacksonbacteria bacterium RIFCSPHIGHO2_02_FULL_44_25]OGY73243.1 MAG: 50S ribosomal protein L32 [Candidatus Jacksonbacteria bacterium RIFCSPLOWO2_12_FULL_44_15b]HCA66819.1 50S ribosomal protein L32 [Candidatus Jacksonbacteria bacterium]HCE86823.1 50S ribosomal protein L32 [Candidatus Jacksonbacteria bacterium]